jgi:hypothetical protein
MISLAPGVAWRGLSYYSAWHKWYINDVEKMTLDASGNVGIGTTSPATKLHVDGSILVGDVVPYGSASFTDAQLILGGTHNDNTNYNTSNQIKLLISGGDNDSASPYYIMCEDENGNDQFWVKGSTSASGNTAKMFVNGNVGIGTNNPNDGKLEIQGYIYKSLSARYYNVSGANATTTATRPLSIYASHHIATTELQVYSDRRIKKNIVDADDAECLEVLRLLKPKRYQYKDDIERGTEPVWGFIAQEVRETLPYATSLGRGVVPNIYELANVSQSNVITFTNFNTSNLESNATTLIRTKDINGEDHDVHLAEVIDEHTIRVEEDLTEWIGSVDETGNVVAGNQLFIYGQRVDDFVSLQKSAIFTVATSALQEVDRQLQAEKAKVATLETQLASVLARLDALESA